MRHLLTQAAGTGITFGRRAGGSDIRHFGGARFPGDFATFLDAEKLAAIRIILIGATLILVIRYRPRGLLPEERLRYRGETRRAVTRRLGD